MKKTHKSWLCMKVFRWTLKYSFLFDKCNKFCNMLTLFNINHPILYIKQNFSNSYWRKIPKDLLKLNGWFILILLHFYVKMCRRKIFLFNNNPKKSTLSMQMYDMTSFSSTWRKNLLAFEILKVSQLRFRWPLLCICSNTFQVEL